MGEDPETCSYIAFLKSLLRLPSPPCGLEVASSPLGQVL